MAETTRSDGPAGASPGGTARWVRVLLILSLALNVLILGIVGGAALRMRHMPPAPVVNEVSFGPFTLAFRPEDRAELRRDFLRRAPDFRAMREAERADFAAVLAALRADTFDEPALVKALDALGERISRRIELGRELVVDRLRAMSPDERRAFADRLEKRLGRMMMGDRDGDRGGDWGGDGD